MMATTTTTHTKQKSKSYSSCKDGCVDLIFKRKKERKNAKIV
jgi:hypothetical protein